MTEKMEITMVSRIVPSIQSKRISTDNCPGKYNLQLRVRLRMQDPFSVPCCTLLMPKEDTNPIPCASATRCAGAILART